MLKTACLLSCLLYVNVIIGQFSDTTHYHMKYAAMGAISKATEGDSYNLNNAFGFEISKKHVSLNSSNSWVYGKTNGQLSLNDFSSGLNFDLYRAVRTWYYWGLANYTTSYSLHINNQFQLGGGLGVNAIRKPNAELVISDGILFESSNLNGEEAGKSNYVTVRNSLRVKYRWVIKNIIVIDGMHFWQPSVTSLSNYIVRSANNLSLNLNKWLSLTASVAYNRYNQTDRENLLINFGLSFEKYF